MYAPTSGIGMTWHLIVAVISRIARFFTGN